MTALLPTTRKICWYTLHSLLFTNSHGSDSGEQREPTSGGEPPEESKGGGEDGGFFGLRKRFSWSLQLLLNNANNNNVESVLESSPQESPSNGLPSLFSPGKFCSNLVNLPSSEGLSPAQINEVVSNGCCGGVRKSPEPVRNGCCGSSSARDKYDCLDYSEAPTYLKFNPYITGGYRSNLTPLECIKSVFWWTNETLNIWTHLGGWLFFLGLTIYDSLGLMNLPHIQPSDQKVITLLLITFQICMLLSALYHVFCCSSEKFYRNWLSADLFGVSVVLLGIYLSGIYYAFSCIPFWLNFYLISVGMIFASVMVMQIFPFMHMEHNFRWRLVIFGGWGAYGVVPTIHWAILNGGFSSVAVSLLLPRIFWMYVISGAAFFFYLTRIPERLWPGLVNYLGSSHQIWHILIFAALYHWHNTGILYLQFRANLPCMAEYAEIFPDYEHLADYVTA